MQSFLVRHAEAVDETLTLRDPHRHLTAHGRDQARHLGDRLRWHDCHPVQIWTSPLVRAIQTTELVAAGLACGAVIEVLPALAPDGSARDVMAALHALPAGRGVMLIGHEPALSAIGALLVGAPDFEALGKAQAARIHDGTLRWRFAWDDEAPHVNTAGSPR
ncbi:MAG: histidine phosphatase family protein [Myxococcota bacterium]|nr:histidine phosphatase family protein [Myxococcota bacterium]